MRYLHRWNVTTLIAALALLIGPATSPLVVAAQTPSASSNPHYDITQQMIEAGPRVVAKWSMPSDPANRLPIAFIMMHPHNSYLDIPPCREMAQRGFAILCVNDRMVGAGKSDDIIWDDIALDLKAAVDWVHRQPNIDKVVFIAYSGGGPIMSYYQTVAENGVSVCQDPNKFTPCSNALAGMTPADGMVLLESHVGYATTSGLLTNDPSVIQDDHTGFLAPGSIDPKLNAFLPDNGYNATDANYSQDFLERFFAGQTAREARNVAWAQQQMANVRSGGGPYPDDEPMIIPRNYVQIWTVDLSLLSQTKGQYDLITPAGITHGPIHTVRVAGGVNGNPAEVNFQYAGAGTFSISVRSFLSTYAVKTNGPLMISNDDIQGIDWASSNTSTPSNLEGVHVPALQIAGTGWYWAVPSEIEYQHLASADKSIVFVEGMEHALDTCKACEQTPGQYGDAGAEAFDYIAQWTSSRFP
jgi:hypothetical protein